MKLLSRSLSGHSILRSAILLGFALISLARAEPATNAADAFVTSGPSKTVKDRYVTPALSKIDKDAKVYSVRFPGGSASSFFKFLGTNGFSEDTVLLAGTTGDAWIPAFTVNNVRLKDVAKSIEVLTEGALNVELVELGETSDVNIWTIRSGAALRPLKTRACAMPNLLGSPRAAQRIDNIVNTLTLALEREIERSHRRGNAVEGHTQIVAEEKIVVIVGPEIYVEAVAAALEAAEKVAAGSTLKSQ